MNVLVVAPQPFYTPRGTAFSVYYRTLIMAEQGVKIDVLTYGAGQDVDIPGARIRRIPRLKFLEPIPIGPSWQKLVLDIPMILWTIALLLRHRYPVVHAHEEAVFWCRFLKPIFRFELIYDMHSSLPQQLGNFKFTESKLLVGTFTALERTCLQNADAVITICPDLRDYVLKSGIDPGRHILIENSIFDDVRVIAPVAAREERGVGSPSPFDGSHKVILYAGTFEAYQGIDILVEAFAKVVQRRRDVRLLLVGGTDEQVNRIRRLVESRALGSSCILTGRVPKAVAIEYTQSADVLVSPRVDGTNTPLKIYEQLASGKPIVATRIWSHTQVLDESVCFLVEPECESMASGILRALEEPSEAAKRVRNAQALYDREYARPIYVQKIRHLLGLVGLEVADAKS